MSWVKGLARPEILAPEPYAHAAWEGDTTRLHANELPWRAVIERLTQLYQVPPEQLLICHGQTNRRSSL